MKVLLTGGAGFLGSTLIHTVPKNIQLYATLFENQNIVRGNVDFHNLDIRNESDVKELFDKLKPSYVIHTAAKSSPDFCEMHKDVAWDINVMGTRNIIKAAKPHGSHIVFMSSNQVYDGDNPPYNEKSEKNPLNQYAKTKDQSEKDLIESGNPSTIFRLLTMYGWPNPEGVRNSSKWVIDSLREGKEIKVVDDMFGNYLYVKQAAHAIWEILLESYSIDVINVAGSEKSSLYDFAVKVARTFELDDSLISPVPKDYFPSEAPRPLDTTYDIAMYKSLFKTKPFNLHDGLLDMKSSENDIAWENDK